MSIDNLAFLLCNFDSLQNHSDDNIKKLWSGDFSINCSIFKEIIATEFQKDKLSELIKTSYQCNDNKVLEVAINAFLTFCEYNWNPHPEKLNLEQYLGQGWLKEIDVVSELQRDSEPIFANILYPELLYISHQIFHFLFKEDSNLLHTWWYFRSKVVHQRILEDTSATIYSELEHVIAKLSNELLLLSNQTRLQVLLCLELAQAYLVYGRVQKTEEYMLKAREIAGLKIELTGILGKRTKFQQKELPQLALQTELDSTIERCSAEETHGTSELPTQVELQDDLRLQKIHYSEKTSQAELPSLEQTLCCLIVQYLQKSQPKDDLATEEIQPYIEAILNQKSGPYSTRVAALMIRCKMEANHKRTVERAMLQCEAIVNDKTNVTATSRLSYLFASGLPPAWTWRQQLADLYLSLGLVKAALEHYEQLGLWEDVVVCYTILQLRHKAAEVIRQQIEINPTVKLYCLLGDATDDVSCYEKAWEFSEHRSGRAQRHWGNFLFDHKKYLECIPHYEKSVEINSLQESVWLRLGYAALMTENWELSGRAYRRYTYLQPHTFEAWNNLARVYVQGGEPARAHRALLEALRYNYDNWKLWENVIVVSMDTGHFDDVIRGIHRLLDLKQQYKDLDVLTLLVRAVVQELQDAEGNPATRIRKRLLELFGRITSIHQNEPAVWMLYSDISPTYLLKAQRLLKAYRGYAQTTWSNSPDSCRTLMKLAESLLEYSMAARQEATDKDMQQAIQQLSSARLTAQAIISSVDKQNWPETNEQLTELNELLNKVTEYMKSVM